jgi:hypothetical protein
MYHQKVYVGGLLKFYLDWQQRSISLVRKKNLSNAASYSGKFLLSSFRQEIKYVSA